MNPNMNIPGIRMAKNPYGEIYVRRKFLTAKIPYGENSLRRKFGTAKKLTAKILAAKVPTAKTPSAGISRLLFSLHCQTHLGVFAAMRLQT